MPVPFSAFHWQPVRNTKRIAFIASRSATRGLWQPSGCSGLAGSNRSILTHNSSGILQWSSFAISPMPSHCTAQLAMENFSAPNCREWTDMRSHGRTTRLRASFTTTGFRSRSAGLSVLQRSAIRLQASAFDRFETRPTEIAS